MKSLELSYIHNEIHCGKAYDVERTYYRPGISMFEKENKITFISYSLTLFIGKFSCNSVVNVHEEVKCVTM